MMTWLKKFLRWDLVVFENSFDRLKVTNINELFTLAFPEIVEHVQNNSFVVKKIHCFFLQPEISSSITRVKFKYLEVPDYIAANCITVPMTHDTVYHAQFFNSYKFVNSTIMLHVLPFVEFSAITDNNSNLVCTILPSF